MKERISPIQHESIPNLPDVVVDYHPDLMQVGLGLEMPSDVADVHFVDAIYGGVPSQTKIGKLLVEKMSHLGVTTLPDHRTSDEEAEWFNQLGRAVLDSITGSSTTTSLHTWFDRPAVNRLIRILRKARDLSFGKDE